jgi:hypothetical protein
VIWFEEMDGAGLSDDCVQRNGEGECAFIFFVVFWSTFDILLDSSEFVYFLIAVVVEKMIRVRLRIIGGDYARESAVAYKSFADGFVDQAIA